MTATPGRPRLLITGVPTPGALEHAKGRFFLTVWREEQPVGSRLAALALGHDAVIVMPGDRLDAATIAELPDSVRVLGTQSVGTEHIDIAAATARGLPVFHAPPQALPHTGADTDEARTAIGSLVLDGVFSVFSGVPDGCCVNPQVLTR